MHYNRPDVTHTGTISGEGTTSVPNEVIYDAGSTNAVFVHVLNIGTTNFHIAINGETNTHLIPVGYSWRSGTIRITEVKIVETGAEYAFTGGSY